MARSRRSGGATPESTLQTVVDLAIHKFEIDNGSAVFAQEAAGFSGRGENLEAQLFYRAGASIYQGEIKVGSLQLKPAGGQPLNASTAWRWCRPATSRSRAICA